MIPLNGELLMRLSDKILILSCALLFIYWAIILILPGVMGPLQLIYSWLVEVTLLFGYQGAFIVSFLGNATVLLPFPYIGVPFVLGGLRNIVTDTFAFDPWLVGILAGLGATLGEMVSYLLGRVGGKMIDEEQRSGFREFVQKHPRSTPLVLWFLAATPIPDDVLIVPLGAAKYSWWKVFVPQFIGKTMFLTVITWAGRLGMEWIGALFGADFTSPLTKSIEVIALLLVIIAIYIIVKRNWTRKPQVESTDS